MASCETFISKEGVSLSLSKKRSVAKVSGTAAVLKVRGATLSDFRVAFHTVGTVLGRDVAEPAFCATFLPGF